MDIVLNGEKNLPNILENLQEEKGKIDWFPNYVGELPHDIKLNLEQALTAAKYIIPIGYMEDYADYHGSHKDQYRFHQLDDENSIAQYIDRMPKNKRNLNIFLNPRFPDYEKAMQILKNLIAYDKQLFIKDNGNEIGLKERESLVEKIEETRHFTDDESFKNNDLKVNYGDGLRGILHYDYDKYIFRHDKKDKSQDGEIHFSTTVEAAEYILKTIKPEMVMNIEDNNALYFSEMYDAEKYFDIVKNLTESEDYSISGSLKPVTDELIVNYSESYTGLMYCNQDGQFIFSYDEKDRNGDRFYMSGNIPVKFGTPEEATNFLAYVVRPESVIRENDKKVLEKCVGIEVLSDFTFERNLKQNNIELLVFKNKINEDILIIDHKGAIYRQGEDELAKFSQVTKEDEKLIVSEYILAHNEERQNRENGQELEDPDFQVIPEMLLNHYQKEQEALEGVDISKSINLNELLSERTATASKEEPNILVPLKTNNIVKNTAVQQTIDAPNSIDVSLDSIHATLMKMKDGETKTFNVNDNVCKVRAESVEVIEGNKFYTYRLDLSDKTVFTNLSFSRLSQILDRAATTKNLENIMKIEMDLMALKPCEYKSVDPEFLKFINTKHIQQLVGSNDIRELDQFFKDSYKAKLISMDQYMEFNNISSALVEARRNMNKATREKVNEFTGKVEEQLDSLLYLKARNYSLDAYCKNAGYTLQKAGDYMKVNGLPGVEDDSVLIKGNSFTAKDGELCGDTVSFVRRYENKSKNEAIIDILASGKDNSKAQELQKDMKAVQPTLSR